MNRSDHTPISDELLSAYIDGTVTNQERATVEAAISADPALAWEVESLRRTVELLQALPPIALPRSFVLSEDQVADVLAERRAKAVKPGVTPAVVPAPRSPVSLPRQNFWQAFLAFFNSGNLLLRNATAVAAALFVVVLITSPGGPQPSSPTQASASIAMKSQADLPISPTSQAEPAPASAEEAAAPQNAEAAPAESVVPVAQSAAPMAEMPVAPDAVAMDVAPAGMDTGASAAGMRAMPESRDAPAARMLPEVRVGGGPEGGSPESGPALFQAAPAGLAPMGGESVLDEIPPEEELRQPINGESENAPVAKSVAEVPSAEAPAAEMPVEETAVEESPPAVAAQSTPAGEPDESVAQESQVSPALDEPESTPAPAASRLPWAGWGWLQSAAGGLFVVLGALWFYTRRA